MAGTADERHVRPRLGEPDAVAAAAAQQQPAAGQLQAVVSPLAALLDRAVESRQMVKDPRGEVYTGFACYRDLANSQCNFVPMNSNRAINRDVVHQRVRENLDAFDRTGRYMEFGQINLIIIAADTSHDFLIMDGQHRCEVMHELHRLFPDRELWFQFRARVVASEPLAFDELKHFQRSYPTDSRSFFRSRADARTATAVLLRLKAVHSAAFKDMILADRRGRSTGDPVRPYLNDNLVFWLLQDSGLLAGAVDQGAQVRGPANAASILTALQQKERRLAELPRSDLGKGATENMRQVATRIGCWLGFFREGVLHWRDTEDADPLPAPAPAAAAVAVPAPECAVCLEKPPEAALLPCGHRCVCMTCAAAVRAARPPQCPLCRAAVADHCRIFV